MKGYDQKLASLNNHHLSLQEKIKIINQISSNRNKNDLWTIFTFPNLYGLSQNDLFEVFQSLSYKKKIIIIKESSDENYQKSLISKMTHWEYYQILHEGTLQYELLSYVVSLLSAQECHYLCRIIVTLKPNIKTLLLQRQSDAEKIKYLLKKKIPLDITDEIRKCILKSLTSDEEKLACLTYPNKYDLFLNGWDRIDIILSLSESEITNCFKNDYYHGVCLNLHERKRLALKLSDDLKISFLNDPNIIDDFFDGYPELLINALSEQTCRQVLLTRSKYKLLEDPNLLIKLISKLSLTDRFALLNDHNEFNLTLTTNEKNRVIMTLPDEDKVKLLQEQSFNFNDRDLERILYKIDPVKAINLLVFTDNYLNDSKFIKHLTNELDLQIIRNILQSHNSQLNLLCEKHLLSFVRRLSDRDKINIFFNRSKYQLKLTDQDKIELLKLITNDQLLKQHDNIFTCFDDPETVINYYGTSAKRFASLNACFQNQIVNYLLEKYQLTINKDLLLELLKYTDHAQEIVANYHVFSGLFNQSSINIADFIQYGINTADCHWDQILLTIIKNNNVNEFISIYKYFDTYYYCQSNNSKDTIKNFLEILNFYHHNHPLCLSIMKNHDSSSPEKKSLINFLFHCEGYLSGLHCLSSVETYRLELIKSSHEIATSSDSISELKNTLCKLLFLKSSDYLSEVLKNTGKAEDLEILKFNNRDNPAFDNICDDLIIVTELFERINDTFDIEGLRKYLLYFTADENIAHTKKLVAYCSNYEEYLRRLYEYDYQISLTKISELPIELTKTPQAIKLKSKYGGDVYDLSHSKYVLTTHVKSHREKIEDLIIGTSSGDNNYISMTPISHRGQQYYFGWEPYKLILAYDTIPNQSFIYSSTENMGTNWVLERNTTKIPNIKRKQRGVLETSGIAVENNSETLLYRQGLIPCGIIIPSGTMPNKEAIAYHKKYHLPFIITQAIQEQIKNPQPINLTNKVSKITKETSEEHTLFEKISHDLRNSSASSNRKIAILADPHALYEPTLACLLDIKKQGINEIYSLGDNIGHGPNPKEVLDLLNKFNVKSVYGNHELYLQENGMSNFRDHLMQTGAYERTKEMTAWIKSELTNDQMTQINRYPERYEITDFGPQPLILIHSKNAYNREGEYSTSPTIAKENIIIQGHEHFANTPKDSTIQTLRAVGIGQADYDDGKAAYYILEIVDGNLKIKSERIPYHRNNLLHTINESSMPVATKKLIKRWVGIRDY